MAEYIEREALKNDIAMSTEPFNTGSVFRAINRQPAADVVPVVHGKWVYKHRHRGGFRTYEVCDELGEKHRIRADDRYEIDEPYCSECGKWNESVWLNYCPSCGARMDGGADDDNH